MAMEHTLINTRLRRASHPLSHKGNSDEVLYLVNTEGNVHGIYKLEYCSQTHNSMAVKKLIIDVRCP